jgi:phosphopantothenoylcysteine decarboxylase/phosphopantothenate--cysteine ligase
MNTNMWENPITQDNLARLCRISKDGPRDQRGAGCRRPGLRLGWGRAHGGARGDPCGGGYPAGSRIAYKRPGALSDQHIVVTAGPTWEAVDDVRFLGNRSSGKMGFALAEAAAKLGAEVTLIAGPVALATPARFPSVSTSNLRWKCARPCKRA